MAFSERDILRVVATVVRLAPLGDARFGWSAIHDATGKLDDEFEYALREAIARGLLAVEPDHITTSGGMGFTVEYFRITSEGYQHLAENGPRRKVAIPDDLRWAIWERDDFRCQECGSRRFLSVDHILAESRGGTLAPTNLRTLCISCNSRKGAA